MEWNTYYLNNTAAQYKKDTVCRRGIAVFGDRLVGQGVIGD